MLKSLLKAQAARRGARFLPGGWITMLALSPRGRSAMRSGWNYVQRRRR
jgi:predicted nuclease with RNAse H fold